LLRVRVPSGALYALVVEWYTRQSQKLLPIGIEGSSPSEST